MLGELPRALGINGHEYPIDSDYRNILAIFSAFNDDELTDAEKGYVCLNRLYDTVNFSEEDIEEAYRKAVGFINYMPSGKKSQKKFIDWEKDEQLIFPALNAVAGTEVRLLPYMHWWTFMGYFQNIESESLFGTVLSIRQKRAKGKKLEKWEKEFEHNNLELISIENKKVNVEDKMASLFDSLPDEEEGE